jgi:hypothetical protein
MPKRGNITIRDKSKCGHAIMSHVVILFSVYVTYRAAPTQRDMLSSVLRITSTVLEWIWGSLRDKVFWVRMHSGNNPTFRRNMSLPRRSLREARSSGLQRNAFCRQPVVSEEHVASTAVTTRGKVFWVTTQCILETTRRFGGTCRFHGGHNERHGLLGYNAMHSGDNSTFRRSMSLPCSASLKTFVSAGFFSTENGSAVFLPGCSAVT